MIRITCQSCEKIYEVAETYAGKTIACPACKSAVKVPSITTNPPLAIEMPTPAKEPAVTAKKQSASTSPSTDKGRPKAPPTPSSDSDEHSPTPPQAPASQFKEHPVAIVLSLWLCFPIGLILVWTHSRWTTKTKGIWTGAYAGLLLSMGCCGGVIGTISRAREKQDFAEANRLWVAGDKPGAVAKYKTVLDGSALKGEWPAAYQRVIEFEADQGNTSSARSFLEKADKKNVSLSFESPKAKDIMAHFQKEREEQRAAELAKQKEAALAKKQNKEREQQEPKDAIKVSAYRLYSAYQENEVSANHKYKGKLVELSGFVHKVTEGYVKLKEDNAPLGLVYVSLNKDGQQRMASLRSGQGITVRGKCTGNGFLGIEIVNAELLEVVGK